MPDGAALRRGLRRAVALVVALSLVAAVGTLAVAPTPAGAAGTVLFQNSFTNRTVDGTGTVVVPTPVSGPNAACLTASGNTSTGPLLSCNGASDPQGSGKLRLTPSGTNWVGGVFGQGSFPTSNGLDVTFDSYQWGGGGADGIAFLLAAVDPANPVAPAVLGPSGGSLGYSTAPGVNGLTNAYLGVGLDVFGNFSAAMSSGTGCPTVANFGAQASGTVAVRGPGNARAGYCGLTTTYNGTAGSKVALRATARAGSVVPVQVLVNPTGAAFTSDSGQSVAAGSYKVIFKPVGATTRTLGGSLPSVAAGMYPSSSWLNASGVPKQLAFGFVGSTGSVTDVHEVANVKVLTFNPVPELAVATTSYAAPTSSPGDPVTYRTTARVLTGANVASPVSVTQSVPVGVVPLGAYGTGWTCAAPAGRSVTCTTTAGSFAQGTVLPAITTVAIVTGSSVAESLVRSSSPAQASSADASPGSAATTTAGTLPAAPASVSVAPVIGPLTGGGQVVVSGANITAATAVEVGTTAQMQAGTPVTLLPCPGAAAAGCFTVNGTTLVVSSMPARSSAADVSITVVTAGVAGADGYTYADKPAAPAAPTAVAGISSATVSWVAPASNGSPLTGYAVTPYLNGVAQTSVAYDASSTSRTLGGLVAGGSYTFAVTATNAYGTSAASSRSAAVVPYVLPGAPAITATTAGSASATLTWTTPSSGGGTISGYVVTPYVGAVAQPTQTFDGSATTRAVTGLTPGTAYTFTVAAMNQAGTGPASARSPSVTPNVSPSLTFGPPPAGEVGVPYSHQLVVTDGTSPFAWSISSGALPAGVTLDAASGLLGGTPTAAGNTAFTVRVTDASGQVASRAATLAVAAAPVITFSPTAGEVGVAYSQQPTLTGGTPPTSWTVSAGSLPPGLTLGSTSGTVAGTPTASGTYSVTLIATGALGQSATRTVSFVVVPRPTFAAAAPPAGQAGVAYSATLAVNGGTAPLTWTLTGGTLPSGLSLASGTGVLSGTPTLAGSSSLTVTVTDAYGQTATKSVTLVVAAGPLVIVKTADVSTTVSGAIVRYTITVSNTGSSTRTASVSDPLGAVLDDASYRSDATATVGTVSYASATLGWTGDLPASGSATITYSVIVDRPDPGDKLLTNSVTSSTLGTNCASTSVDPRCTSTVTVAGLTIVKSVDAASTTPGSTVRVTIVVTNTGPVAYPGVVLADDLAGMLDDGTYRADAVATLGNLSYTSPTLTWTGDLGVGGQATITYTVKVADPVLGDRSLTGTVVSPSAGSPCPGSAPAPSCTVSVPVLVPALAVTIAADRATVTPGGEVVFTLTLANTGETDYSATTARIELAAVLDDATYSGGAVASAGSVSFDPGTSSLVWSGALAMDAEVTVTATVTVRNPDPGDKHLEVAARSLAPGSTCPVGATSPSCSADVEVRVPELRIVASAAVSTTTPGSVVEHTVTAHNTGQTAQPGATFAISLDGLLDDADYDGNAAATVGTVTREGSTLRWTGDLAIGATVTLTYAVQVRDPDDGDLSLVATVTSSTAGATCPASGGGPECESVVSVLVPALAITTVSNAVDGTTTPGSVLEYAVTVTNTGQVAYAGMAVTLDLAGALDDADYNFDASITAGSLVTNPDATVDWILDLAPGASAFGTLSLTVKDPADGDRALSVVAVSDAAGSPCREGSAGPTCRSDVTVLIPGLTLTKTASASTVVVGGTVDYTISVVNDGETTYAAAAFEDDLSKVLTDAAYGGGATATSGSVSYNAPTLSWVGSLAPGASATISYTVTVLDPDPGDKHMLNTVVSDGSGSNCGAGSLDPRCTATVQVLVPGLTIVSEVGAATTAPGATVGRSFSVTNSGTTPQVGVSVTDTLAGLLDDASYGGDAVVTAGPGSVAFDGTGLTWTGDLGVGVTATVTYSTTVNLADVGNDLLTTRLTTTALGANCEPASEDPRCTTTVPVARLTLSQSLSSATTTPGSVLRLNGTFTNTGQVPYTAVTVSTPRADLADDATGTGDQTATSGTLVLTATAVQWTGDIPVGGVVGLTGTLTVHDPDLGNRLIRSTMTSTAVGNNCFAGSTDGRCTALTTVLVPQLTITKVANATSAVPGATVEFTITVHNTGQTPYAGATFVDPLNGLLANATYAGDATATTGTVTYGAPTLSWTGDLGVGATAVVTFSVTVDAEVTGESALFNAVRSTTVGSTCPPASSNTACRVSVDVLVPGLAITATTDRANATLGTTVTGTIVMANTGQITDDAATFSLDLSDVFDDATLVPGATFATSGTVNLVGQTLVWTGGLAPGALATVTYEVTVDNPGLGDLRLSATATSTSDGNNCEVGSEDARCSTSVVITDSVSLTLTKTSDVATAAAGDVVTYTVTVTNSQDADVVGADLTDPLTGILDDATYGGDAVADPGTLTYDQGVLTWGGTVPALGTVTITYSVTVDAGLAGDELLTSTITSATLPASNNCTVGGTDPRCRNTVPVAALRIEQTAAETSATPGDLVHLTATYTNVGQVPYNGISVASPRAGTSDDTIPTGDQAATSGVVIRTADALTWSGDIPIGGMVTLTRSLQVKNPNPGNGIITATVSSDAEGSNCALGTSDPLCTFRVDVVTPELTITKAASSTFVVPGQTANYTITIRNTGETPYAGAVVSDTLVGVLDDATFGGSAVASTGVVAYDSPTLTWTGDLAVGAVATITYSVTARSPATGDKTMINPVASTEVGSTCPPATGNSSCRSAVAVLTPALTVVTSANAATAVPSATVTFTVTATNTGQVPFGSATFSVPLAGVLDDATFGSASAPSGSVGVVGSLLTWTGPLTPGASTTVTYTVVVDAVVTGDHRLAQTATSTTAGTNCAASSTDARCATSVPIAGVLITNSTDVATARPTAVVRSTVTFTNVGQVPFTEVSISDSFAGSLDDATYNGDASATAGELVLLTGTGRIVWTGDLAVGDTVTVTGSLTVNNPDLGDRAMTTLVTSSIPGNTCPTSGPAATCSTAVSVLTPGLTITKAVDTSTAGPGATVGHTITITNSGDAPYIDAVVLDRLVGVVDDASYGGGATTTSGEVSYADAVLSWTGDLAIGDVVVITYQVVVDDPVLGDKVMVDTVVSDEIGSSCPTGAGSTSCTSSVTILVPRLEISLIADRTTTVPGATVGYTATIANAGQTDLSAVVVSAQLSELLDDTGPVAALTASAGAVEPSGTTLVWTVDLAVGATATVTYRVVVDDPDVGDRTLSSSIASSSPGSTCPTGTPCTNVVTVLVPGLAVSTVADVATATPGDLVRVTTTIANTGETAFSQAAVSSSLVDIVDDAMLTGPIVASSGVVDHVASELSWTGSLPVGATATITYTVRVRSPDPGNQMLTATVEAPNAGSTCPPDGGGPECTVSVPVLTPGLTVAVSAGSSTTTPGATVGYTVTIANSGETAYDDAVVDTALDGVLADASYGADAAVVGGGILSYADSTLRWTGDLAVGGSATITYTITVDDPDLGDKAMVTTVTSTTAGSTCLPGDQSSACSVLVRVLVPSLSVTKTADLATVTAGGRVAYTITLVNDGETAYAPAAFTDPLGDVLDDATYSGGATASVGTVTYSGETLSWNGPLDVGETATITYVVDTRFPATGDHLLANTVQVASAGADCGTESDPRCRSTVEVLVPALDVTKVADVSEVVAGGVVAYTISATATGETDYPSVTLTDPMTGVLDDASFVGDATASTGDVTTGAGGLTWTGPLVRGETLTISYSVEVGVLETGDAVLVNRVASPAVGSSCPTGVEAGCWTSTPVLARSITIDGLTPSFSLAGRSNTTVASEGAVTLTVSTNSPGGYIVTVKAGADHLSGSAGNEATIPIDRLRVRESGESAYRPLSAADALVVHAQGSASAPGGDAVSSDYEIDIPFVPPDSYSATLDYVVSAQ